MIPIHLGKEGRRQEDQVKTRAENCGPSLQPIPSSHGPRTEGGWQGRGGNEGLLVLLWQPDRKWNAGTHPQLAAGARVHAAGSCTMVFCATGWGFEVLVGIP